MQTWAYWVWVGKKGMLEWGNIPDKMPMDTEKPHLKQMGRYILMWETGFFKHELQM